MDFLIIESNFYIFASFVLDIRYSTKLIKNQTKTNKSGEVDKVKIF